MSNGKIIRKFDKCGRLSIPISIRRRLQNNGNGEIEIQLEGDTVLLMSVNTSCMFCDNEFNLATIRDKYICNHCAKVIQNLK